MKTIPSYGVVVPYLFVLGAMGCGGPSSLVPDAAGADASSRETGASSPARGNNNGALTSSSGDAGSCSSSTGDQQGCGCALGQSHSCYTGPAGTNGVGACHAGTQKCQAQGEFSSFGACVGQALPSSASACVATPTAPPDAAAKVVVQGPPDAATTPPVATAVVGAPCTPGQVETQPQVDAGSSVLNGTGNFGQGGQVLYCDSSSVWETFPDGNCQPAACLACLQAHCSVGVGATPNCTAAFDWLAECGPDRTAYFQMLAAGCNIGGQQSGNLASCKDVNCYETNNGPCSLY